MACGLSRSVRIPVRTLAAMLAATSVSSITYRLDIEVHGALGRCPDRGIPTVGQRATLPVAETAYGVLISAEILLLGSPALLSVSK